LLSGRRNNIASTALRGEEAQMIDHTAVNVSDLDASKRFYDEALKPLGYSLAFEVGEFLG
jgi:hypothetical protein